MRHFSCLKWGSPETDIEMRINVQSNLLRKCSRRSWWKVEDRRGTQGKLSVCDFSNLALSSICLLVFRMFSSEFPLGSPLSQESPAGKSFHAFYLAKSEASLLLFVLCIGLPYMLLLKHRSLQLKESLENCRERPWSK